jgi:Ca-activated chloride channel family protein
VVEPVRQPRLPIVVLAAVFAAAGLDAQSVFRGGTDVVLLNVTVFDQSGRLVPGLDRGDFQVFEDGVVQEISNFARDPQPIALSLLIDSSTSMEPKLAIAQEAATGFAKRLSKKDVAQIIDFDSQTQILQTFTNDEAALERAIRRTRAGGSTSLYNALYVGLDELKRLRFGSAEEVRRQAIVLLSDGEDTSSLKTYEDVLDSAKRSEVIVYAINLKDREVGTTTRWNESEYVLRSLTQETGGKSYTVDDANQLPAIYSQIADELANQYTIGYTSKNAKRDGAWRRINVQVTRGGSTARTKLGYFAPKSRS